MWTSFPVTIGGGGGEFLSTALEFDLQVGEFVQLHLIFTVYFISNFTARHVQVTKTLQVSGSNLGIETI